VKHRRLFLATLVFGLFLAPLFAGGQQRGKVSRVGYLTAGSLGDEAFRQSLRQLGYVEGQNVTCEDGIAERKPERLLARVGLDVFEAVVHLRDDPRIQTIPILTVIASAMTHTRRPIWAAGFDGYTTKAIHGKAFLVAAGQVLDGARGRGEAA